jgi:hypothetical protein
LLPFSPEPFVFSSAVKNIKIRIYRSTILPVVLCGCETWPLTLREERRLRTFKDRVQRRIFGLKRDEVIGDWRKLHNKELHKLYSSPSIIIMMKSRRKRWAGHIARMGRRVMHIGFWRESLKERDPLGLIWLGIGTSGWHNSCKYKK